MNVTPPLCLLTLAHAPHFPYLAGRLDLQAHFNTGPTPPTVVVFDDEAAQQEFCTTYSGLCGTVLTHPVTMTSLLGSAAVAQVRKILFQDLCQHSCGSDPKFRCFRRSPERIYSTLKKFYGALYGGPPECESFFVSDAETFPVRPYHWQEETAGNGGSFLMSLWGEQQDPGALEVLDAPANLSLVRNKVHWLKRQDQASCKRMTATRDDIDTNCNWKTARLLNFTWGHKHRFFWRQNAVPTQFWVYSRALLAEMVAFVESTKGEPFYSWFPWVRITDQGMYQTWAAHSAAEALARGVPPVQEVRNLLVSLKRSMPAAYAVCCPCPSTCSNLGSTWSCFSRHHGTLAVARIMAESVGVFGLYGADGFGPTHPAFSQRPGPAWCINNCFQGWGKMGPLEQRLSKVSQRVQSAFRYDSRVVQGEKPGERGFGWKDGIIKYGLKTGLEVAWLPEDERRARNSTVPPFSEAARDRASTKAIYRMYEHQQPPGGMTVASNSSKPPHQPQMAKLQGRKPGGRPTLHARPVAGRFHARSGRSRSGPPYASAG